MTDPIPTDNVAPFRPVVVETDHFIITKNAQQIADMFVRTFYTTDSGLKTLILYRKVFHSYNGSYYAALEDGFIRDRIYNYLSDAYIRGPGGTPMRFRIESGFVSTIIECIASITRLDHKTSFPFWLRDTDQPFPASGAVVFRNGILDMLSGKFVMSTPEFVSLDYLDMDYDADATWDEWDDIIHQCLFKDAIEAFQEAGGLTIIKDMSFEKIFHPHGPTRSGKGLIMTGLRQCVGLGNCASSTLQSLTKEFGLYGWRNKRMATITELRLSRIADIQAALTKLLGVSGCDPMPVEGKNRDEETLQLETRIWIESNEIAGMPDSTGAFRARLIVLRFKGREGEEDRTLKAKVKEHGPAIFNWFRSGYLRLIERGKFIQPASSKVILDQIKYEGDPLLEFFETRTQRRTGNKLLRASVQFECERWFEWRKKRYPGHSAMGKKAKALGIETFQDAPAGGTRYYKDIEFVEGEYCSVEELDTLQDWPDNYPEDVLKDNKGGGDTE